VHHVPAPDAWDLGRNGIYVSDGDRASASGAMSATNRSDCHHLPCLLLGKRAGKAGTGGIQPGTRF
jgi:hypothetical protein